MDSALLSPEDILTGHDEVWNTFHASPAERNRLTSAASASRDAAASGLTDPVVPLSPACASFDRYRNFEIRGVPRVVTALPGVKPVV